MFRHQLTTTIDIAAPPKVVWEILIDLDHYPEWNPFIVSSSVVDGDAVAQGVRLRNRMEPPGGRAATFSPTVTSADEGRTFEWLGRLLLPGLFDGRHRFELEPIDVDGSAGSGTRLHHSEQFRGLLVPLFRRVLDTSTRAGFEALNAALRTRAEARAHTGH